MPIHRLQSYPTLPSLPQRGPLPPIVGVVIPLARTNLVTNPSIEAATTGYTAFSSSIARSATKQRHGTYSLSVTPSAPAGGVYYQLSLTANTPYAISIDLFGQPGIKYDLGLWDATPATRYAITRVTASGWWQRVVVVYTPTSTATYSVLVQPAASVTTGVFYVDGVQVESCADGVLADTTYIDGDQLGVLIGQSPPAYGWNGTPHASTSYRTALTRAGGYVVNLSVYHFLLTGLIGLGMAVPQNVSVPYTVLDGANLQRIVKPPRTFSLPGRFQADTIGELMRGQSDMRAAFDRDLIPLQQPMVLTMQPQDECGTAIGEIVQAQCVYAGGLEGNDSNYPAEDAAPAFTMYVPFLIGGAGGAALTVQQTVSNAAYIAQRSASGNWAAMSTGANALVSALLRASDGTIYAGGNFTAIGASSADYIAYWNGSAWNVVGSATALNAQVNAIVQGPDGSIYAGGNFTNAGGDANADYVAKWDGAAWSALSTGANNTIYSLAIGKNGYLYAGGNFTSIGGVGATRIAYWDGSVWNAMGTGANGIVRAIAVAPNGRIAIGGEFTTAGGTTVNRVAIWNGSAWTALSTGVNNTVRALAYAPNGTLYVGGDFTSVSGDTTITRIAAWNGFQWSAVGGSIASGIVYAFTFDAAGNLVVAGSFTDVGTISAVAGWLAKWNGASWIPLDITPNAMTAIYTVLASPDGALTIGGDFNSGAGTVLSAALTSVTNDTPGYVHPTIVITGPSAGQSYVYQMVNNTTGYGLWFDDLRLSAGEKVTLTLDPARPSFISTVQGDITNLILPASQPTLLYLAPGANQISFFAAASSVTATLRWQRRFNGLADVVL